MAAHELTVAAIEKDIGKAPAGKAQVVFFRSASSPGDPVGVRDAAGGLSLIDLEPGMYFVSATTPGTRAYATADTGPFSMDLDAGRTYYVQVIRKQRWRCAVASFERGEVRARGECEQGTERTVELRSDLTQPLPALPCIAGEGARSLTAALPSTAIATANIGTEGVFAFAASVASFR